MISLIAQTNGTKVKRAMTSEIMLILPQSPQAVTADVVTAWYNWYRAMAESSLEGSGLEGPQLEYETTKRMLELCAAADCVNEAIRQKLISRIAREHLYSHAPEGWNSLRDMIHDVLPSITSAGYASELATIAEIVSPYADRLGVDIYGDPSRLGYLREAASGLREIITSPLPEEQKARVVRKELTFILKEAETRQDVRARYRHPRGEPASGFRGKLPNGEEVLMLVGSPTTIAAIAHRIDGQMVHWRQGKLNLEWGNVRPSKSTKGQQIRPCCYHAMMEKIFVLDDKGNVIEEIET